MPTLSAILITKNEEKMIRRCLESIKWADEIIVIDSGSTDQTIQICQEYTHNVYSMDWVGFGPQKNRALQKATSDWVLSIDADEELTPKLIQEIQLTIAAPQVVGYSIKRFSSYCGRFIRYGDWQRDYCLRLFERTKGRFSDDLIHEKVIVSGEIKSLNYAMLHFSYRDLTQVLDKVNSYSTYGAQLKFLQGKRSSISIALAKSFWCFIRGYFLRRGFLDGQEGFLLALSNALGTFYRYMKLVYLEELKNDTKSHIRDFEYL